MGACGLTPGYTGHAFWDSDSWIFPALLLMHPERARSLVMFRSHTLPAAQARAQARGLKGAMYPWEADPENGSEQTPHFAYVLGEREIHVNADIAIAQWQYWLATHDRDWLRKYGWPVIRNVADFWASRAIWNADKRRFEIVHVTSVAESYNDVPNDTFTNASAQKVLKVAAAAAALVGERADPRWAEVASKLYIPFSQAEQHHLDFDASVPREPLEGSTVGLLMYPSLDLPMTAQVRRNDFDYTMISVREGHHEPHGMGMAPASIAAAAVGDAPLAVAWLQSNFTSNLIKPPFNVRTETATNNTGYFVTSSGGFLQNLLYGFSGLRITRERPGRGLRAGAAAGVEIHDAQGHCVPRTALRHHHRPRPERPGETVAQGIVIVPAPRGGDRSVHTAHTRASASDANGSGRVGTNSCAT